MNVSNITQHVLGIAGLPSVSGHEAVVFAYLISHLPKGTTWLYDKAGNLICQKGPHPEKVAVVAHADKIGFYVTGHAGGSVSVIGHKKLPAFPKGHITPVIVWHNQKPYQGLLENIGDGHNDLWVKTAKHPAFMIGDVVTYATAHHHDKKTITGPYLDNSLGVSVCLQVLAEIPNGTVIFSVQEETGHPKAGCAVHTILPEHVIVVDTTYAIDEPGGVKLVSGHGPSICIKDSVIGDKNIINDLIHTASKHTIPYQVELWEEADSDANAIADLPDAVPFCFLGIPIRFPHSINQVSAVSDIVDAVKVLTFYIKENI